MKRLLLAILLFTCANLFGQGIGRVQYRFEPYDINTGLSSNLVQSITRDDMGYMWFGTNNGLNRFDGIDIKRFYHTKDGENQLRNNYITALYVSNRNEVWVGHREGIDIFSYERGNGSEFRRFEATCEGVAINRLVNNIASDKDGNILISTADYGAFIYYAKSGILSSVDNGHKGEGVNVNNMFVDDNNNIWVVYQQGDVLYYDKQSDQKTLFTIKSRISEITKQEYDNVVDINLRGWVRAVAHQRTNSVYFVSVVDGVVRYDIDKGKFRRLYEGSIEDYVQTVNQIAISDNAKLFIAGKGGVAEFDTEFLTLHKITPLTITGTPLVDDRFRALYIDKNSDLWCGTTSMGVYHHTPIFDVSQAIEFEGVENPHITTLTPIDNKEYLVGTDGQGLHSLDPLSGEVSSLFDRLNLSYIGVCSVSESRVFVYAPYQEKILIYDKTSSKLIDEIGVNSVFSLNAIDDNTLYIGTDKELYRYECRDNVLHKIEFSQSIIPVSTIVQLEQEQIMISTLGQGCFIISSSDNSVIKHLDVSNSALPYNYVTTLSVDDNRVWVGTEGEGFVLYDYEQDRFIQPAANEKLGSSIICKILRWQDYVWVVSQNRVYKYHLSGDNIDYINSFMLNKGVIPNSAVIHPTGIIYLGSINGLVSFDCAKADTPRQSDRVYISDLLIFNQSRKGFSHYDESVELNHDESTISFRMNGGCYHNSKDVEYEYMLSGVDDGWRRTTASSSVITYANLSPNSYTFYARRANSSADDREQATQLELRITPPIYHTTIAYILYIIVVFGVWWRWYSFRRRRRVEKFRAEIERVQNENESNLQRFRLDFFSKITHEIRTPLTLITAPVLQLMSTDALPGEVKDMLAIIHNNCNRLHLITNQILDFKNTKNLSYELNPSRFDLQGLVTNLAAQYKNLGAQKSINVVLEIDEDSDNEYSIYSDKEAITKIVTNLLNNALKFTRNSVTIELSHLPAGYKITISDNGKGIANGEYEKIFELYYQQGDSEKKGGVGIGLSLSKMLSELLEGDLYAERVDDNIASNGASFTLVLPFALVSTPEDVESVEVEAENIDEDMEQEQSPQRVLIVDDEDDMRRFVAQILSEQYECITASSAENALELLGQFDVSLIVSDVMMGGMNGYEFCREVRSNLNTSHIPVVLLTVRSSHDDHVRGFDSGADGYLLKPFHPQLLVARINQIFQQRQKLIKRYVTSSLLDAPLPSTTSKSDNELIERATEAVLANITNEAYNVEMLVHDLGLSRTALYLKLKAIVNMSGNVFIRHIRLKEACRLMNEGEERVNAVCYSVGFNTPSYFTKCFVKQYGVLPNEYINKLHNRGV